MKLIKYLFWLFPAVLMAETGDHMNFSPTSDSRIRSFRFSKWGELGQNIVDGVAVPPGKVWLIKAAGIATDDGDFLEWMMQIKIFGPTGNGGYWLVPLHRQTGFAAGTPTEAIDREILLVEKEALCARANGVSSDKRMALLYSGFEFDASLLPQLLGIKPIEPPVDPALVSVNNEIIGLEKSLEFLKGR